MIYKFKSKAAGDVIMLGPTGDHILRVLGREPAAKGIIEVADMPGAVAALEQAVAADDAARAQAAADAAEGEGERAPGEGISLRQRAWPLVEMLRRCHAEGKDIVWGV